MSKHKGEIALLLVAFVWGTGYVATATAFEQFDAFQILAIRFVFSTLLIGSVFFKKIIAVDKTTLKYGVLLGVMLFGGYAFQTSGLQYTTPGKNAFITATFVVVVPFIGTLLYRRKIDAYNIAGAFTALAGILLMSFTLDGSAVNIGDILTFIGMISFSFHLFFTSEFMSRDMSAGVIVTLQMATCSVLAVAVALVMGQTDFSRADLSGAAILLYMVIFTTTLCFFMQTWAQKFTSETKTAIIISLECVFGAIISVVFGFENLTTRMFFGGILILAGVLITEIRPNFWSKKA